MMLRRVYIVLALLLPFTLLAEEKREKDWLQEGLDIPEVAIYGQRPMKEIGTQ